MAAKATILRLDDYRGERYAAGQTGRTNFDWHPANTSINDLLSMAGPAVRAKVRQLVRDFPYFARAKRIITDFVVGDEITLQSRALGPDGKYSPKISQKIEEAYSRWADEADIAGRLHLNEIVRLAKDQDTECGEFIIATTRSSRSGRFLPLALQMYEADWLTDYGTRIVTGNEIEQGVEYNPATGETVAYHLTDPSAFRTPQRIPSKYITHGFETLRPGQLRGISAFVPAVMVTRDLQDCMEGEIDGFKFASKWLAFKKSMNPNKKQGLDRQGLDDVSMQNLIIEYLQSDEEVTIASNPRPSPQLTPFVRLVLSMLAVGTGVPYELISGDYQGLNMAVTKVVRADFRHVLKPIAKRHIRQCCDPIFKIFLDAAVLHGRLDLPGYWNDPYRYQRCIWQPPVADPVDRLRDGKADIDEKDNLLRSPQEIVGARGRQLEDVYTEIVEAKKLAEAMQLTDKETSTALANNPAAINKE
jgi:lambda family phage portal protein